LIWTTRNGQVAKQKTCIVPAWHGDDDVDISVPRTGKPITLSACISSDGFALKFRFQGVRH
jgi:hypothetical protein